MASSEQRLEPLDGFIEQGLPEPDIDTRLSDGLSVDALSIGLAGVREALVILAGPKRDDGDERLRHG